jgi:hypothetical protein
MEPPAYAAAWVAASGVAPKYGIAVEFLMSIQSLWLLASMDGVDATNLVTAEHIARRALMIQKAVRRSPRSPDFSGLHSYMEHMADHASGAATPAFDRHVAALQKDEAIIMKSQRLAHEEVEADEKRKKPKEDKKNKNPKDPKGAGKADPKE